MGDAADRAGVGQRHHQLQHARAGAEGHDERAGGRTAGQLRDRPGRVQVEHGRLCLQRRRALRRLRSRRPRCRVRAGRADHRRRGRGGGQEGLLRRDRGVPGGQLETPAGRSGWAGRLAQVAVQEERPPVIPAGELLLVAGAFALYVFDAGRLLYADEFMMEGRGNRWRARDGAAVLVSGRRPLLPDLLRPWRALLPVSVERLACERVPPGNDTRHFLAALRPFGRRATVLLMLFFPGLPLVLRTFGTGAELLAWMVAVYAVIGSIAWRLWRYRHVLELPAAAVTSLALECALCAPFAINIVRKLSGRIERVRLHDARRVLGAEGHRRLRRAAAHRIDDMLSYLPSDGATVGRLGEQRARLQLEAAP